MHSKKSILFLNEPNAPPHTNIHTRLVRHLEELSHFIAQLAADMGFFTVAQVALRIFFGRSPKLTTVCDNRVTHEANSFI